MDTETNKEIRLTEQHIKAIEKSLNRQGIPEVIVRREGGRIVILRSDKKRII